MLGQPKDPALVLITPIVALKPTLPRPDAVERAVEVCRAQP
jgi:hypothetical protein